MFNIVKDVIKSIRTKIIFRNFGSVGRNSYMQKPLRISERRKVYIGNSVIIRKGVRLEVVQDWFGEKMNGEIHIGDETVIEQNCHFVAADKMEIGKGCLISANVFISDCEHEYKNIEKNVLQQPLNVRKTSIGEGTFLGYGACVMAGVNIGKHCVVGANSVVLHDVPDYTIVAGAPAVFVKKYCPYSGEWLRVRN